MERTYRFSQEALARSADATSARKAFDLSLPALGPYCLDYTPNGRHLLIGGRKGHLALVDWARPRLTTELQVRARAGSRRRGGGRARACPRKRHARLNLAPRAQVRETVRAVKFLHNTNFFAAAQEKCVVSPWLASAAHAGALLTPRAPHLLPARRASGTCTFTTSAAWRCTACASTSTSRRSSSCAASSCSSPSARRASCATRTRPRVSSWRSTARDSAGAPRALHTRAACGGGGPNDV